MRPSPSLALVLLATACAPLPHGIDRLDAAAGPDQSWHRGPEVAVEAAGTARFVRGFVEGIDEEAILELVEFADELYAAPASLGYDLVLDRVTAELRDFGFDAGDARLELEVLEVPPHDPSWTPVSGKVALRTIGGGEVVLHSFDDERDPARALLPTNAPTVRLVAPIARSMRTLDPGEVLVTDVSLRQALARAKNRGAVAVVSAAMGSYNVDPSGRERHRDAIQVRTLDANPGIGAFQISPRSLERIDEELARSGSRPLELVLESSVRAEMRPLRTLVARVVGDERPDEAVVVSAHVHGPGAVNNASGMAGMVEGLRTLCERLRSGDLEWPDRSLVFLFGVELHQTESWLARTRLEPVAGISADMIGSRADSGAIALLEREPDPGAWRMLPPDEASSWGAPELAEGSWTPSGLSLVARCGMVDTGLVEGGWTCADHPWEGGSDHDVFLQAGVPAVLFWHFVDFTYHTSLDRTEAVDPAEVRRSAAAILSTMMAVASPEPRDLDRYLRSLDLETRLRVNRAQEARDEELAAAWRAWADGARAWLRNQCLGIDEPLPTTTPTEPVKASVQR